MESEVRERDDRVQVRPEIHFVPCLPQEQSIFHDMQYNHQPDSDRRRLSLGNSLGLSCTQLLAQVDTFGTSSSVGATSIPSYAADSQMSMDSWVNSSKMESNLWTLSPESSPGTIKDIVGEGTMEKPQCDVLLTPQKFICDLNHTPEEMVRTRSQKNKPELSPITLDTPGKRLPEPPHATTKKSLPETGSPAAEEKERKRARDDDDKTKLKTPQQTQKRKKIRGKVAGDGYTNKSASKPAVKKASATPTPTPPASAETNPEANGIHVRPKRSCKRILTFNTDVEEEEEEEEEEYSGLTFTSDGRIGISSGGKILQVLDDIPERRLQSWTRSETTNDQSVTGSESLSMSEKKFLIQFQNIQRKRRSSIVTEPHNLLSEMKPSVFRKKRSNRDAIASKLNARVLHLKWRRHSATGPSDEELWERKISIDNVTELFNELDITRDSSCLPHSKETALVLHQETCKKQKALYMKDGSIIPYPDEKNYQTKVELDEESTRVWKLLMVSIDSEGVDGTDEDKQKWWEEERKMFHEHANTFISRMRLVQGDRRFSPWKGSVVDSVVGVFLTQNVADHTSSSAFMDIAAEFPVIFNSIKGSCHEDLGSSVTDENLDSGNAAATPRTHNQTCFVIDEIDDDGVDAVCSQESSKSSDSSICSTNQSKKMLLDPPTNSFEAHFQQGNSMNLNEVPIEVESCDEFRNNVDEGSQIQQQEQKKTIIQSQHEEPKTRTDQHTNLNKKKPAKKSKTKNKAKKSKPKDSFDWDSLRREAESSGRKRERTERTMDAVDWDALRCTDVKKIADLIRKRGMHDMLSHRIKDFLNRMVQDHGEINLEWLRDVPPDKAKEYLLRINGLGLKSVECVRLLSLHQTAFPVDTNVGRIAVRLGWVPLQPLPDELQMHLLDLYPVLESVQKYLWPRLCKLDQKTLYELHYHMITFGKVFCTKKKPNCKACPMKAECRHYASARTSAQLALPEAEEEVTIHKRRPKHESVVVNFQQSLFLTRGKEQEEGQSSQGCEPIIEEPTTPEPPECPDIEDCHWNNENEISRDPWENKDVIPTIILGNKKNGISTIFEVGTSKDLVVLNTQTASIPRHKLKNKEKLRTEHLVYELPDSHPILRGFKRRDPDDMFSYLFAIWSPGETANSIQLPKQRCVSQEGDILCHEKNCFPCNNRREVNSQTVRGTILIPCRTAMGGRFPLNGTYFQTNEVFADHGSSVKPIYVPRESIGSLRRAIVYFGSSASACFGGLSVEAIQYGFWTGYVCVRGFDRKTRKSKALVKRLHSPPSKKKESDYE